MILSNEKVGCPSGQNQSEELKTTGIDVVPHRMRMKAEWLDEKSKDPDTPFRLILVCVTYMRFVEGKEMVEQKLVPRAEDFD